LEGQAAQAVCPFLFFKIAFGGGWLCGPDGAGTAGGSWAAVRSRVGRPGGATTRPALPQEPTKVQATAGIAAPKNHDFCLIPVFSSFWPIEKRM
jgi:hypothetical protein